MKTRTLELSVGILVILAVAAVFFLALRVSGLMDEVQQQGYTITAHFQNAGGLTPRAKVTLGGVTIGRVSSITLDPKRLDAVVTMRINSDVKELSTDSAASILTAGLLGEKYIGITPGADDTFLKEGGEIEQTQSSLVLEDLIGKFLFNKATAADPASTPAATPASSPTPAPATAPATESTGF